MQISPFSNTITAAIAIIGLVVVIVQAYSKWLELQTARINRDAAKSRNAAPDNPAESQTQLANDRGINRVGLNARVWREIRKNRPMYLSQWFATSLMLEVIISLFRGYIPINVSSVVMLLYSVALVVMINGLAWRAK